MNNKITFSDLREGMSISFYDDEENSISAEVSELYFADDDENKIIGCAATSTDGTPYALYEEDGVEIYSSNQNTSEVEANIQEQTIKNGVETKTETKKIIMPINEIKPPVPKKEINNLFKGRTESEKGNAKFPDWDIVPPNQFINPRIKPQ